MSRLCCMALVLEERNRGHIIPVARGPCACGCSTSGSQLHFQGRCTAVLPF